jgi:hypothetical protein
MLDFRKIEIFFNISYFSINKIIIRSFNIKIGKYFRKYLIKYNYTLSNGNEIVKNVKISKQYFEKLFTRFLKIDFEDIKLNNPELTARRDGSSTELIIKCLFKNIYCEIFVLEHFYKEYNSMKYLYDLILEIFKIKNDKINEL